MNSFIASSAGLEFAADAARSVCFGASPYLQGYASGIFAARKKRESVWRKGYFFRTKRQSPGPRVITYPAVFAKCGNRSDRAGSSSPWHNVVTESCIKCKYTDCVDVCPVDCFREGPNMLVIDPEECIDCTLCVPECPVERFLPRMTSRRAACSRCTPPDRSPACWALAKAVDRAHVDAVGVLALDAALGDDVMPW